MKIAISGDRYWSDREVIKKALSKYLLSMEQLIVGDCRGADRIAAEVAQELGFPKEKIIIKIAEWGKYHSAAGCIRNQRIIDENPDVLLAFHDSLPKSKGTRDCVSRARAAGAIVELYHSEPKET